jgi:hypothetical protein
LVNWVPKWAIGTPLSGLAAGPSYLLWGWHIGQAVPRGIDQIFLAGARVACGQADLSVWGRPGARVPWRAQRPTCRDLQPAAGAAQQPVGEREHHAGGQRQPGQIQPPGRAKAFRERPSADCPGGRYRELPGTAHQPYLEQPGQVSGLVLAALADQTLE